MKYTFTAGKRLEIAGAGDFFRLLSTTSPVNVEFYFQGREIAERLEVEAGFAEQFRIVDFDRVDITSPLAQTVQFETAKGSEIRYDRGAATISGTVSLDIATLQALETINVLPVSSSGNYKASAALAANTAEQIFSPGANTNGALILSCGWQAIQLTTWAQMQVIAKNGAPANMLDGEVIAGPTSAHTIGTSIIEYGQINEQILLSPGVGLYFINSSGCTVSSFRHCRYKLL